MLPPGNTSLLQWQTQAQCEGVEDDTQAKGKQKKEGVAILISDKIYFKIRQVKRDKEGQYTMIKGTLHQEDIALINIYALNTGAQKT